MLLYTHARTTKATFTTQTKAWLTVITARHIQLSPVQETLAVVELNQDIKLNRLGNYCDKIQAIIKNDLSPLLLLLDYKSRK